MATKQATASVPAKSAETKVVRKASVEGRIRLLRKDNPKRPGTKSRDRFALYRDGMSVAEFLKAGGKRADISWDTKHGFIEVVS